MIYFGLFKEKENMLDAALFSLGCLIVIYLVLGAILSSILLRR